MDFRLQHLLCSLQVSAQHKTFRRIFSCILLSAAMLLGEPWCEGPRGFLLTASLRGQSPFDLSTADGEKVFLEKLISERLRHGTVEELTVRGENISQRRYKPLRSSVDGKWLLIGETLKSTAFKQKRLFLYDVRTGKIRITTHENPPAYRKALRFLEEEHGLEIELERERIPGTYHVMSRLPLRIRTEATAIRAHQGRGLPAARERESDFYLFSIQVEARHKRYQVAMFRFAELLSEAPRLEEIWYSPISYGLVFVITVRRLRGQDIIVHQQLSFSDAKSIILGPTFEVTRHLEYQPSLKQQDYIFQKFVVWDEYTRQLDASFYFLNGTYVEASFLPEDEPTLALITTRAQLRQLPGIR